MEKIGFAYLHSLVGSWMESTLVRETKHFHIEVQRGYNFRYDNVTFVISPKDLGEPIQHIHVRNTLAVKTAMLLITAGRIRKPERALHAVDNIRRCCGY